MPAKADYEGRMIVHLRKCFPHECGRLSDLEIRQAIDLGIANAGKYGLVTERDVCLYIDLMFVFGLDFDTSPNFPWASDILNDSWRTDPSRKIDFLYDTALMTTKKQAQDDVERG